MSGDNDDLLLEWRQFLSDEAARSSDVSGDLPTMWMQIKEGKFPLLSSIAERALILPHSNAETERVFSLLKCVLKAERNRLQDPSINDLMTVKSFMLRRLLDVQSFPINGNLKARLTARSTYMDYLKMQQRQEKKEERKNIEEARKQREKAKEAKRKKQEEFKMRELASKKRRMALEYMVAAKKLMKEANSLKEDRIASFSSKQ